MGVIDSVAVERGDQVRRGQTRALLKADVERASVSVSKARAESEADVHSAQVNLEFARLAHTRNRPVFALFPGIR